MQLGRGGDGDGEEKKERKPRVIIATASRRIKHKGTERLNLGISFHHAGPRSAATVTVILHRFYNRPKRVYYTAWPRRCRGHVCDGVVSCLSNTPQVVGPAAKVADAEDAVLDGVTLPRIINLLAGPAGPQSHNYPITNGGLCSSNCPRLFRMLKVGSWSG